MEYFSSRLKELREKNNMTQTDLANMLSYSRTTITKYETGERIPSGEFLVEVSDFFKISLDYLLGRSNVKERINNYQNIINSDILLLIDPNNGNIIDVSPEAEDFYGYSKKDLLSKTIFDLNTLPDNKIAKLMDKAIKSIHQTFYFKHKLANGETRHVKVKTTKFKLNKRDIIISNIEEVFNQIENNKNIIQELLNSLNHLSVINTPYKKEHSKNVESLSFKIGKHLSLNNKNLENIKTAAKLKNIGENKIPTSIINKPQKLSTTEYELVKEHPLISSNIISNLSFNPEINEIVLQHHERIDGSGYPNGMTGNEIKLEAKIITVADVFIALLEHRPYRKKYELNQALSYVNKSKGKKFDSKVVNVLNHIIKNTKYKIN